MKNYELSYLISPELNTEESEKLASEIIAFIQTSSGLIIKSGNPIPKTLGYRIKKQTSALWVNLEFSLEPEKLNAIEEKIKKESKILRHIIVVKNPPRREKEKRGRKTEPVLTEASAENNDATKEKIKSEKKVELKDIDEKLEEILKE
ncbi:30S ribosomal protein S6 [Patescibacteria group bacterium]|nr:30S ribosomal protein S6 [Patescibacteria group bacterium]